MVRSLPGPSGLTAAAATSGTRPKATAATASVTREIGFGGGTAKRRAIPMPTRGTSSGSAASRTTRAGAAGIRKRKNEPFCTDAVSEAPLTMTIDQYQSERKTAAPHERRATAM